MNSSRALGLVAAASSRRRSTSADRQVATSSTPCVCMHCGGGARVEQHQVSETSKAGRYVDCTCQVQVARRTARGVLPTPRKHDRWHVLNTGTQASRVRPILAANKEHAQSCSTQPGCR
jgi:hypothetical protein